MHLPDYLSEADGEILISGHRIGLEHVVNAYNEGASAELLASRYPSLPLSLVHRIIAFYLDHQNEVDAYIAKCASELARQRVAGPALDLSALRRRLEAGQPHATT